MQPTEDIEPPSLSNSARNGKDKARAVVNEWAQLSADECWNSKNMLSLDGGGIRGYWSLLMLEELMTRIAREEERWNEGPEADEVEPSDEENDLNGLHSFWPEEWPANVCHGPYEAEECNRLQKVRSDSSKKAKCQAYKRSRRFLPCHYFDYIFGSSTGALIAIMLGRFRMSVADCLTEYERFGKEIFSHPRLFAQLRLGIITRPKYRASRLEKVFKDVTDRRSEQRGPDAGPVTFHVKAWETLCRSCVTALKYGASDLDRVGETVYLLRSYDHHKGQASKTARRANRGTTSRATTVDTIGSWQGSVRETRRENTDGSTNYGPASNFQIWEIARAATAAPFYFSPFEMKLEGGKVIFEDGGFGASNNPTDLGIQEITRLRQKVGIVVSVGTARQDARYGRGTFSRIKMMTDKATDPEKVHTKVQKMVEEGANFEYFRLNEPGFLRIDLDEWKPGDGSRTLEKMRNKFFQWMGKIENQEKMIECAKALVQRRRTRATDRDRWQHFAIGAVYTCLGCSSLEVDRCDAEFKTKSSFRSHLFEHRGLEENGLSHAQIRDGELKKCMTYFQYREPPQQRAESTKAAKNKMKR